ncbi:MAG TPA: hypothetical protein VFM05_02140 [Candidatus Saccharimonadales bacterium]|nr:hypothetical protein [Candidatus Saccharimonadales bacterium]
MKQLRRILMAAGLSLSLATVSFAGTIVGSRTSRTGTIVGSRTGTIVGSRTGSARLEYGQTGVAMPEDLLLSRIILFVLGWSF